MIPPKPAGRRRHASPLARWRAFRNDILSSQPDHLFRARVAEYRTPFFRSFLVNEIDILRRILAARPPLWPKSARVTAGLRPLLGRSVFVTNGEEWEAQRRIIDPAFEGGRLGIAFPAMDAAAVAAADRLSEGAFDVEAWASHATADVIFRTLFSVPIEDRLAAETYAAFRDFQRVQPVAIPAALMPRLPVWLPRRARRAAARLRRLTGEMVADRASAITEGRAPDDLATRIMTTPDPRTGRRFEPAEMADQVAIFFLAGHETSAALLGWTLWCLAAAPDWQDRLAKEAGSFASGPAFSRLPAMTATRAVLREVLRLYPPVPMMVREATAPDRFRDRDVRAGDQVVVSPWHLGRHSRHWSDPDAFRPERWGEGADRSAWLPFSAGPRACPGAGFAMAEATVLLARALAGWRFEPRETPVPVAHLTLRSRDGLWLTAARHETPGTS